MQRNIKKFPSMETLLTELSEYKDCSVFVIIDAKVNNIYGLQIFNALNISVSNAHILKSSEKVKTIDTVVDIITSMEKVYCSRSTMLICIGGGVVTDVGGLVGSLYKRGIDVINIPTTLLGMVDAAIGGKTAVNLNDIKNVIGTFNKPVVTYICSSFIYSLSEDEFMNGIIEMFKTLICFDKNLLKMFLDEYNPHIKYKFGPKVLDSLVSLTAILKYDICEKDPKETYGHRILLNFGHTIGHVIEATYPGKYSHGQAVAMGIYFLYTNFNDIIPYKITTEKTRSEILRILFTTGMINPGILKTIDLNECAKRFINDKKITGDTINMVTVTSFGKASIIEVPVSALENVY